MKALTVLLLFAAHWLPAQDVKWNEGSVVLSSGDVIVGQIGMITGHDVVLLKRAEVESLSLQKGIVEVSRGADVLPAHNVKSVFYYDKHDNINRRFVSRTVGHDIRSTHRLYEVVVKGSIDVLRRPRTLSKSPDDNDFDYYVSSNGTVAPLWKFYRDVLPAIDEISRQHLTAFIRAHGLQHGNDANVIRIISYYNQMMRSGETVARF